jgi:hypothetical protein
LLLTLVQQPNVLLLDEPTNDLDLDTLRALEDFLDDWPGIVITVSHDRSFLDRVTDELLALDGRGGAAWVRGGVAAWLAAREASSGPMPAQNAKAKPAAPSVPAAPAAPRPKPAGGRSPSTVRRQLGQAERDLAAQAEEGIRVGEGSGSARADVAVVESWKKGFPPVWRPQHAEGGSPVEVTEPHIIEEEAPDRWIEIRAISGALVTVIELVSPSNKRDGRAGYLAKRESYRFGGVNVVEIDLLRRSDPLTQIPASWRQQWTEQGRRLDHEVAVWRASVSRIEAYPISLRERLPTLRVPLRPTDPDVPLPLQLVGLQL